MDIINFQKNDNTLQEIKLSGISHIRESLILLLEHFEFSHNTRWLYDYKIQQMTYSIRHDCSELISYFKPYIFSGCAERVKIIINYWADSS